jgi:capsular polysaccharide transport system permease protein
MREIVTRFGRHNIGFCWVFCEPLMFCTGVSVIWLHMHKNTLHHEAPGVSVVAFAITGYSNVLLWRNCGNRCCEAVTPNLGLLYHRNVRVIDLAFSRVILEIAGCAMAYMLIMIAFAAVHIIEPPADWALMMAGYLMNAWFAGSVGVFTCACSELSEVFSKFWHPITYFLLPVSGLAFMVNWIPHQYQKLALFVPTVDGTELLRQGYFGPLVHARYNLGYMSAWCLGLELVGLTLLKHFALRVEPQ